MLSFCTFQDFSITPNSSHLCINLEVCKVVFFFQSQIPFVSYSIQWNGKNKAVANIFILSSLGHVLCQESRI
jgi:hypothetical protein